MIDMYGDIDIFYIIDNTQDTTAKTDCICTRYTACLRIDRPILHRHTMYTYTYIVIIY